MARECPGTGLVGCPTRPGYHSVSVLSPGETAVSGVTAEAGPRARSFQGRQLHPSGNLLRFHKWHQHSALGRWNAASAKLWLLLSFAKGGIDTRSQLSLAAPSTLSSMSPSWPEAPKLQQLPTIPKQEHHCFLLQPSSTRMRESDR